MTTKLSKTVLVGGGTGFIGSYLRLALKSAGYQTRTVSRHGEEGLNLTWTDIEEDGLPANCVAVVNTAGQNIFNFQKRWTQSFKDEIYSSRVSTTAILTKAIARAETKPKVFVTMSGVGYYPPSATAEYTEDSPGGDVDFFSKLTTDWEKSSQLKPSHNVRVVNIRSGVVLGRHGGIIRDMYLPFFFGVGGPVGTGKQFFPWIHIHDIVGMILFAIEQEKVKGVLNGVAPQVITNKEFAAALGKAMFRPYFLRVPTFILEFIMSAERAKIVTEGQKVIPKRALELGFTYDFPDILSACKDCAKLSATFASTLKQE